MEAIIPISSKGSDKKVTSVIYKKTVSTHLKILNNQSLKRGVISMNILLCCSAGMSTSLLVTKMEESAKNQGVECHIWAVGSTEVNNEIDKADVILLGPQVRYLLSKLQEAGKEKGIPVATINPMFYGLCNGEEVLKQATTLIKGE
jgi:PTS system cellobiose-specific IIB component